MAGRLVIAGAVHPALPFKGNNMVKNVGGIDKVLRIAAGLLLIGLATTGTVGWWGYLGVVPLLTGLTGRCPPYALLGINTCKTAK